MGKGDDGGLCFDGLEVAMGCSAGTDFGAKLTSALASCMEGGEDF